MRKRLRLPTHPGGILRRHYIEPLSMTISGLAVVLGVSRKTVSGIVNEHASITPDMALCLSKAFETTPELWLNMQRNYDLWQASHKSDHWKQVEVGAIYM
jgi:antitoxin HigA-1